MTWTRNNTNTPISGYTQEIFGDGTQLVAYSAAGVSHNIPVREDDVLKWFGIPKSTTSSSSIVVVPGGGTTTFATSTTVPTLPPITTQPSTGGTIPKWGQCGGKGWTGSGTCVSGSTCKYSNDWYSQCL